MRRTDAPAPAEAEALVHWASDQFLTQVRVQLPLARLAVVLLDHQQDTGRVVFSWKAPLSRGTTQLTPGLDPGSGAEPTGRAVGLGIRGTGWAVGALFIPGNDYRPVYRSSINVTLHGSVNPQGSQEILGAALLQAPPGDGYGPTEQRLARRLAEPLALALDNLRLQQKLQGRAEEADAFQLIAESAASSSDMDRVYRRFAAQVKRLVEYHHLGIYLTGAEAGQLRRIFHNGSLAHQPRTGLARTLAGEEWLSPAMQGEGHIVQDLVAAGPVAQAWPGEVARLGLRSALTVPVVCSGTVVGAVRLSHRRPGAYQPHHQELLQQAASLLGPSMAYWQLQERLTRQSALEGKIAHTYRAFVSSNDLETAFRGFANAVGEIFPVEWVTLSWDNGPGLHSHTMTAQAGGPEGHAQGPMPADCARLSVPLLLGEQVVGALTAGRRQPAFNTQEQTLLGRVAAHIAAAVQSHRHYRRARRQAYQIEQLQRSGLKADSSPQGQDSDQDLLVDAAHALRNPLTSIKGYSSSLLQSDLTWSPEVQQEFLKTIYQETDRLEQVVQDLLAPPQATDSSKQSKISNALPTEEPVVC